MTTTLLVVIFVLALAAGYTEQRKEFYQHELIESIRGSAKQSGEIERLNAERLELLDEISDLHLEVVDNMNTSVNFEVRLVEALEKVKEQRAEMDRHVYIEGFIEGDDE